MKTTFKNFVEVSKQYSPIYKEASKCRPIKSIFFFNQIYYSWSVTERKWMKKKYIYITVRSIKHNVN